MHSAGFLNVNDANSWLEKFQQRFNCYANLSGHFPPPAIIPGFSSASRPGPEIRFTLLISLTPYLKTCTCNCYSRNGFTTLQHNMFILYSKNLNKWYIFAWNRTVRALPAQGHIKTSLSNYSQIHAAEWNWAIRKDHFCETISKSFKDLSIFNYGDHNRQWS